MDHESIVLAVGIQLRQARRARGLTQAALAAAAMLPRLKVIQVESGHPRVSMEAYARLAAALGQQFQLVTAHRPTLDELPGLLRDVED